MADRDELKRAAAERALDFVETGMVLGLGTGTTAAFFVEQLGGRVAQGLSIIAIPTSERTAAQARRLGIPLASFTEHQGIDLAIDGADEVQRATLDQIEGRALHFIGTVDREIDPPMLRKGCERDPKPARLRRRALRRRDRDDRETLSDAAAQLLDKEGGCRPGAQPQHHAVFDKIQRAFRGGAFQLVAIRHQCEPRGAADWRIAVIAAA